LVQFSRHRRSRLIEPCPADRRRPAAARASTPELVEQLVKKIVLAPEDQDPLHDGDQVNSDRRAIYQAVAVLFPWAARKLVMPAYKAGTLTVADIAKMVHLPTRYVQLVMSDVWPISHEWLQRV
jgi:hypothetical protein